MHRLCSRSVAFLSLAALVVPLGCVTSHGGHDAYRTHASNAPSNPAHGAAAAAPAPPDYGASIVVAGDKFSCRYDGRRIRCWGANEHGQLGDGTTENRLVPTDVDGFSTDEDGDPTTDDVTALAAGSAHACAAELGYGIYCWGLNWNGQLGTNRVKAHISAPVPVLWEIPPLATVTALAAGSAHTCAVLSVPKKSDEIYCWGDNAYAQLGNAAPRRPVNTKPVKVAFPYVPKSATVIALVAGEKHTCAAFSSRELVCWGANDDGQLGGGSKNPGITRATVALPIAHLTALTAGAKHTCASFEKRDDDGVPQGLYETFCWGANEAEQLGREGDGSGTPTETKIYQRAEMVTALAAGRDFTCAATANYESFCWGANNRGQLGNGEVEQSDVSRNVEQSRAPLKPLKLPFTKLTARTFAAKWGHSCAAQGSRFLCWGANESGQLGDGTRTDRAAPDADADAAPARDTELMVAGARHTCAVALEGRDLLCWGGNFYGQLGNGTNGDSATPVRVEGFPRQDGAIVTALSAGDDHTCVALSNRRVLCWGSNHRWQLGNANSRAKHLVPIEVADFSPTAAVTALASGKQFTCAALANGELFCWGANGEGQIGIGSVESDGPRPMAVHGFPRPDGVTVAVLAAGERHICAALSNREVVCWGDNNGGQLGVPLNELPQGHVPIDVRYFSTIDATVTKLAAGNRHTCAALSDRRLVCWGTNNAHQLGDDTRTHSWTPVNVREISLANDDLTAFAANHDTTCAGLVLDGVRCWGGRKWYGYRAFTTPVTTMNYDQTTALAIGVSHICARRKSGGISCLGSNNHGELGNGTTRVIEDPVAVIGF